MSVHVCNYGLSYRWVKKFGEHNGLDVLLDILRACVGSGFTGKDTLLRRIQHHCVRCIKAFMNNKVLCIQHEFTESLYMYIVMMWNIKIF